jgi:hypothetical protein
MEVVLTGVAILGGLLFIPLFQSAPSFCKQAKRTLLFQKRLGCVIDRRIHYEVDANPQLRPRYKPDMFVPMKTVALTAHFDGEKVQFDEPYELKANARLMIVVLPAEDEQAVWSRFSANQLAKAYGKDEPEYTAADLRP